MPGRENHISMWAYGFRLTWSRTEQGRRLHGLGFKSLNWKLAPESSSLWIIGYIKSEWKNIRRPFPSSSTLACFLTEPFLSYSGLRRSPKVKRLELLWQYFVHILYCLLSIRRFEALTGQRLSFLFHPTKTYRMIKVGVRCRVPTAQDEAPKSPIVLHNKW